MSFCFIGSPWLYSHVCLVTLLACLYIQYSPCVSHFVCQVLSFYGCMLLFSVQSPCVLFSSYLYFDIVMGETKLFEITNTNTRWFEFWNKLFEAWFESAHHYFDNTFIKHLHLDPSLPRLRVRHIRLWVFAFRFGWYGCGQERFRCFIV